MQKHFLTAREKEIFNLLSKNQDTVEIDPNHKDNQTAY